MTFLGLLLKAAQRPKAGKVSQPNIGLDPKLAGSTYNATFDFTSQLGASETISTQVCTSTVYSGTDASPASMINGSATASGSVVTQSITAGTAGVVYYIKCVITTSLSQTLNMVGLLAVVPDVV